MVFKFTLTRTNFAYIRKCISCSFEYITDHSFKILIAESVVLFWHFKAAYSLNVMPGNIVRLMEQSSNFGAGAIATLSTGGDSEVPTEILLPSLLTVTL